MKSSTLLTSVVFHLTPTRTRFDLTINAANGKTEKIASGLLNPFLAHLKTARDQIAQGGYSIRLEIEPGRDAAWFTKGTVDRFVRFVSTPEILERVYTIESEILQIDEAIAIQRNNDMGFSTVDERQGKHVERNQGNKAMPDSNDEKAIILYKPGEDLPAANGPTGREENSKVQFLRVLETRRVILQKEQGMAFARAGAAGFNIDDIENLASFSESFGASRLMDACLRFRGLWKRKHETGQWLELEAAEATTNLPDFSPTNASGLMLCNGASKPKDLMGEYPQSRNATGLENNGRGGADFSGDQKHPTDPQLPQEYFAGQYPHHMYPPWPIHAQPGAVPVFQPYPMPYYPNYPGSNPYFQPPYLSADESNGAGQITSQKRPSAENLELGKEVSPTRESRKKANRLAKKSRQVVIRNINYITAQRDSSSGSDANFESECGTDVDSGVLRADALEGSHMSSARSSKQIGKLMEAVDRVFSTNDTSTEKDSDSGHWQAFQNCLLRGADDEHKLADHGMFAIERDIKVKRRQKRTDEDHLTIGGRDPTDLRDEVTGFNHSSENGICMSKASNDPLSISRRESHSGDDFGYRESQKDFEFNESARNLLGARRTGNDDFMVHGRESQSDSIKYLSDPAGIRGYDEATNRLDKKSIPNLTDESFVVPVRSNLQSQYDMDDQKVLHMYSEPPKDTAAKTGTEVNYEPDVLGFMPERGLQKGSIGYDPALDYEMQAHANARSMGDGNNTPVTDGKKGLKKSDKDQKSKGPVTSSEKKKMVVSRQGKPSKSSPLEEARARAEKLRSFKAELQKEKKQQEEEQVKRLETLKIERQIRIAARNGPLPSQSSALSQQTKKQLPRKTSVSTQKGSKFSDAEPLSVLPLQSFPARRTASLGSIDSKKPSKPRSSGSNSVGNKLSRSASSLSESKQESNTVKPASKASMVRIRRLSEPRMSSNHLGSSAKLQNTEPVSNLKRLHGPESKKISAIMNLDRTLAATLPELKIKPSKEPLNIVHSKSASRETECVPEEDDNLVIEKNVVMLEGEKPDRPVLHSFKGKGGSSPITTDTADEHIKVQKEDQHNLKVTTSAAAGFDNKPIGASHPRVSSLEDPCNGNSEYCELPSASMKTAGSESLSAHVAEQNKPKQEKLLETFEKPHVKESSKGIRRLLMFGRKNHSSAQSSVELDNTSSNGSGVDDNAAGAASSSEAITLKNLISRDETPTATATQQKHSRHFSLLSPFRRKSGQKKQTP